MRIRPHYVVAIKANTSTVFRLKRPVYFCVLRAVPAINGNAVGIYHIQSERDFFAVPTPVGIKGC